MKMKGVILLNGEPYKGEIDDTNALVFCADGAYNWAKGRVRIDENLGDFDSAAEIPFPRPAEIFPSEKNETDGEIALEKMLALAEEKGITLTIIHIRRCRRAIERSTRWTPDN